MCSRALKRYLASDPRLRAPLPLDPMACFFTRIFSTRCSCCTSECANIGAILTHLNASPEPTPTANGGSSFCETLAGLGFCTKFILLGAGLKPCTPTSSHPLVVSLFLRLHLPKEKSPRL